VSAPGAEAARTAAFQAVLVSIAAPDAPTAQRLARLLVEGRLAACVQIIDPIRSVYRWRGAVEEQAEVLLLAKSSQDRVPRIGELLRREHPYELPELAAVPITAGSPDYLSWLAECLG
jgi:periplasmic divalent cation tolerance protein